MSNRLSLRKRAEKLLGFLAMLAVVLNFLVPVTHSLIASADAGEYVEICTKQGIELVKVDLVHAGDGIQAAMQEDCSACPDCPLCQFGQAKPLIGLDRNMPDTPTLKAGRGQSPTRAIPSLEYSTWLWPALRAPPTV